MSLLEAIWEVFQIITLFSTFWANIWFQDVWFGIAVAFFWINFLVIIFATVLFCFVAFNWYRIVIVHTFMLIVFFCSRDSWVIFRIKTIFEFCVLHEKFQKPAAIRDFFSNALHIKGLKIGWKKVHRKSLSLRVRKNSCNFIFYGPNLLVWVTHGKF